MQVKFASLLAILCLASVARAAEGDYAQYVSLSGWSFQIYGNTYYDASTQEWFGPGPSNLRKFDFNTNTSSDVYTSGPNFRGVGPDPTDSNYLIGAANSEHCYKRVHRTTGAVTTWLGTCGTSGSDLNVPLFNDPWHVVVDSDNQIWSTSNRHLIKIDPVTKIPVLKVTNTYNEEIRNIDIDRTTTPNTIYIMSYLRVYKYQDGDSTWTFIAGPTPGPEQPGDRVRADGTGSDARFQLPTGLVVLPDGNLYISGSYVVRKLFPATAVVTTVGTGPGSIWSIFYRADTNQVLYFSGDLFIMDPGALAPAQPAAAPCTCSNALTVNYTSDLIPDAAKDATAHIALNESTWEVEFEVRGVYRISNGHVIAKKLDTRTNASAAFTPYVSAFTDLWNSSECELGAMDTPAASLGITATRQADCTRTYRIIFSLVDTLKQNTEHCTLDQTGDDLAVSCNLTLSSVRAYDLTEQSAFLSSETSFSASITLPRNLNHNVTDLMYATLAKCNVLNSPDFAIDCRVPGVWNFDTTFAVSQNIPDWINAASCASSSTAVATFVRCDLNSVPVSGYTEANANVTATVSGSNGQQLTFSLEYTLPRSASATASASLQNFIQSISMLNEKYYYAGADRATLLIETFDTSRLQITQLDFFNANSQSYNLRGYPQFQLTETSNATHFIIEFRPSAIRQDSAFYRNGPHGINVSFLFSAAGTRRQASVQEVGTVVVEGIRVRGDDSTSAAASGEASGASSSGASSSIVLIVAIAGVAVVAVGSIVAAVIVRKNRGTMRATESSVPAEAAADVKVHTAVEVAEDQV